MPGGRGLVGAALTGSERAPYLDGLDRLADLAAAAAGDYREHCYEISGQPVCLRFAGPPAITRLASALSHLSAPSCAQPAFTVRIWDSLTSGLPEPSGPWSLPQRDDGQGVRGLLPHGRGFFQWHDRSLSVLDLARNVGYYWVDDAHRDSWPERAAPLSLILGGWLAERDVQIMHAGAVGTAHGCVLLVGSSGSGKSHVALACLEDGLGYLGDDTCALDPQDPATAYSLYSSAQAQPFTLSCLPALSSMASRPLLQDGGKVLLFLAEHVPGILLRESPLRVIAVVSRSDRKDTYVRPASAAEAMMALVPGSLMGRPGADQRMIARLAQVARGVECVHLKSGRDPSGVARAVRTLL